MAEQNKNYLPPSIRRAGILGVVEGIAGLIYALVAVVHQFMHSGENASLQSAEPSRTALLGYGNAVFILLVFGFVGIAGWMLMHGKKLGRGPVVILQLLLLPIAYYMFKGGQPIFAVLTAAIAVYGLVELFRPASVAWAAGTFDVHQER